MAAAKHYATYPIYGTNPLTGQVWNKRLGTGYVTKFEQIAALDRRLAERGHPFRLRWRNEQCRQEYLRWHAARVEG